MFDRDILVNTGLLVLRIGIGIIFIIHGVPKLLGGVDTWTQLGSVMSILGITFAPAFWGFIAAATEAIGGLFIVFGLLHRPVAVLLLFTMLVAFLMHVASNDPFTVSSNALKGLVVFFAMILTGPGIYSLDYRFFKRLV